MNRTDLLETAARLVRERAGCALPAGGAAQVVEMRLGPLARREGFPSVWSLLAAARKNPASKLAGAIAEALAPRESYFFRDRASFEALRDRVLPGLLDPERGRPARIWSAACGAGQEAYSLAMLIEERRGRGGCGPAEILATDLSQAAIKQADAGLYTQFEVQMGLPIRRLVEHFDKEGERWRVHAALRKMVTARQFNLLHDFADLGQFDAVLLRHTIGHFAPEIRADVLARAAERVRPSGWLLLGAGESAVGLSAGLDPAPGAPGLYQKRAARYAGAEAAAEAA